MNILIYGSGAIGTFLGVQLQHIGHSVTLLGRNKLQGVKETIKINETMYVTPPRVQFIVPGAHYDTIFCTTKMSDISRVIKDLQEKKVTCSQIVFIQNGLAHEGQYGKFEYHPGFSRITVF